MLASRWHSPPKPGIGVQLGHRARAGWPGGRRRASPGRRPRARRRARPAGRRRRARAASSCRRPGALMKLTTLTPARSKSARLAWAIVLLASSASSTTLTLCAMHAASSTSIDSTSNSLPAGHATSDAAAGRAAERRDLDRPLVPARRCSAGARRRAPAPAGRPRTRAARDEPEVELERVRHDLAQPADPQADDGHPAPGRVLDGGVDDRAAQGELVHQLAASTAAARSSSTVSATSVIARATASLDLLGEAEPELLDLGRLAGDHDHPARPGADRLDEPQHRLRVHAVRVDGLRRPRSRRRSTASSGSITYSVPGSPPWRLTSRMTSAS